MGGRLRLLAATGAWAAALWLALEIAKLETPWDHALCGVWGCGPTLSAVVSCHLAWLIIMAPLAILGRRMLPAHLCRLLGIAMSALVLAVVLRVVAREAATWLPEVSPWHRGYFPQRCLFVIATWIDVPLVQLGLVGLFWQTAARSRRLAARETAIRQRHRGDPVAESDRSDDQNCESGDGQQGR